MIIPLKNGSGSAAKNDDHHPLLLPGSHYLVYAGFPGKRKGDVHNEMRT